MRIKKPEEIDVLVNKKRWLHKDYIPSDLVQPKVNFLTDTNPEAMLLRKEAAKALEKLFKKAKKDKIKLYAASGYRSYERQRQIFKKNLEKDREQANNYSARPGQSEHQTGLAIDVTCELVNFLLNQEFAETEEYRWLCDNAHKYGFILRYLKDKSNITGYEFEPWHLRYVGIEIAGIIYENKITLEEYLKI